MTDLDRFRTAQDGVFDTALSELNAGRKRSHWMWFVLPQLRGLGRSEMAHRYGIADLDEARAYIADPVLGPRLRECVLALLGHRDKAPESILGPIDALKFRSCLTLFIQAAPDETLFVDALEAFYDGQPCPETLRLLRSAS